MNLVVFKDKNEHFPFIVIDAKTHIFDGKTLALFSSEDDARLFALARQLANRMEESAARLGDITLRKPTEKEVGNIEKGLGLDFGPLLDLPPDPPAKHDGLG